MLHSTNHFPSLASTPIAFLRVNDSEPKAEFQETVNKSKAIRLRSPATARQVLKAVALAETFAKR